MHSIEEFMSLLCWAMRVALTPSNTIVFLDSFLETCSRWQSNVEEILLAEKRINNQIDNIAALKTFVTLHYNIDNKTF